MTVFIHTYSHLSSYIPQFACQGVDCWPSLTPGSWLDPWLTPPLLCPRPCTGRVWPPTCHVSRVQGFSAVHNSARCWPLQKVEGAQGRAALPRLAPPAATLQSFTPPTLHTARQGRVLDLLVSRLQQIKLGICFPRGKRIKTSNFERRQNIDRTTIGHLNLSTPLTYSSALFNGAMA